MLRRPIALSEGRSQCDQEPASTCSALILESFRPHDALTSPGPVVSRCVHHASAARRSIPLQEVDPVAASHRSTIL